MKKFLSMTLTVIFVLGLITGAVVANPRQGQGPPDHAQNNNRGGPEEESPAAPAIATELLKEADVNHRYGEGPDGGNYVSDVAREMGPGTDFDGVEKCDEEAYKQAVADLLIEKGADIEVPDPVVGEGEVWNETQDEYFDTIQEAIDKAEEGDTILVGPGTYEEVITVDVEGLSLRSGEKHAAVIDGGYEEGDYVYEDRFEKQIGVEAENVTVYGFTVKNAYNGIWIQDVNATIENNKIQDAARWSLAIDDDDAEVHNNVIKDQGSWGDERQPRGLFFRAENAVVINNEMVNAGLSFPQESLGADKPELYSHDIDQSNTINGEPVIHFVDKDNEQVSNPGGPIFLIDSTNITVDGANVDSTETGVFIAGGGNHTIKNSIIGGGEAEIHEDGYNIGWRGIFAVGSEDNTIKGNKVFNARVGIEVRGGSDDNEIIDNLVEGPTWQGINVRESDDVVVTGNTIRGCGDIGDTTEMTGLFAVVDWGQCDGVENLTIEGNTFEGNEPHVRDGSGETDLEEVLEDNDFPDDTKITDEYDGDWAPYAIYTP